MSKPGRETPHTLRPSCAIKLLEAGADILEVEAIIRGAREGRARSVNPPGIPAPAGTPED
jgi:hypothetical protein